LGSKSWSFLRFIINYWGFRIDWSHCFLRSSFLCCESLFTWIWVRCFYLFRLLFLNHS
jgi:hypothetical protein